MIVRLANTTYCFLLEFLLAILAVFFFYVSNKGLPPILALFGLTFGSFVLFILILEKFKNKGKLLYFLTVFPLLLYLGSKLGFQFISLIMIGVLVFWRGMSLFIDYEAQNNTTSLFISFMIGIFLTIYSGMIHYPHQNVIIGILILQIILVLLGLFFSKWQRIKENRGKFILYYGGFLGGAALLGAIVTFGLNLVQFIFFGIASLIARVFAYIIIPMQSAFQFFMNLFGLERRDVEVTQRGAAVEDAKIPLTESSGSNLLMTVFLIALALIAAYYIYKKRNILLTKYGSNSGVMVSEEITLDEGGFLFKKRAKPPKNLIRSEIFYFERFARKLKLGRKPFESLSEWWSRIGINVSGDLTKIYENVRYGEFPSTPEDLAKVKEEINLLKQKLKENGKKESS